MLHSTSNQKRGRQLSCSIRIKREAASSLAPLAKLRPHSIELQSKVDSFKFQVVHLVPTIDVLGIFEVGPHLILTMLGTTITYMLIMRQEEN